MHNMAYRCCEQINTKTLLQNFIPQKLLPCALGDTIKATFEFSVKLMSTTVSA